ncbi:uncharacterized protein LOC143822381 [Paroedura picta]|uniref:uncharacterized protein LOC143822381 n=1 Tax=Paroedura picta TaxID=143630 RepID=UPI0040567EF8
MNRPRSPDFLELSPRRLLSPAPQAGPDQQAACACPESPPAPSLLCRSYFARECEAVAFQRGDAAEEGSPRLPLTIQEETLSRLEPSYSFSESPDGRSPSRPGPEPASPTAGPPDPVAAVPGSEQSAGLAEGPLAAASPVAGLAGVSSGPGLEKASLPSGANVTYTDTVSCDSANATYICTGSPWPGEMKYAQPALLTSTPVSTVTSSEQILLAAASSGAARQALRARGKGGLLKGASTASKIPQVADRKDSWARTRSAAQSHPITEPPFKLPGIQRTLVNPRLKLRGTPRDQGSRLAIAQGNKITTKTSSQKHPRRKSSNKVATSLQKSPSPKRLCKGNLMTAGQNPTTAVKKELTAPCSKCQQLAEENKQLKSKLEAIIKTVALLEGKVLPSTSVTGSGTA